MSNNISGNQVGFNPFSGREWKQVGETGQKFIGGLFSGVNIFANKDYQAVFTGTAAEQIDKINTISFNVENAMEKVKPPVGQRFNELG